MVVVAPLKNSIACVYRCRWVLLCVAESKRVNDKQSTLLPVVGKSPERLLLTPFSWTGQVSLSRGRVNYGAGERMDDRQSGS